MPIDERFYTYKGPQALRTLLHACGIDANVDQDPEITSIAAAAKAREGDLCFLESDTVKDGSISADATACFVTEKAAAGLPKGVFNDFDCASCIHQRCVKAHICQLSCGFIFQKL